MNKYKEYLIMVCVMTGFFAQAITPSPNVHDESDVVLDAAVESVRETPADTAAAAGSTTAFVGTEIQGTAEVVESAFKGESPREILSAEMIRQVNESWDISDTVQMRTYEVGAKMAQEMVQDAGSKAAVLDVRNFFMGISFPEGTSAYYRPDFNRLVVHQTAANLQAIDHMMGRFSREPLYKQVKIETKFIEVEQETLNELGFNWDFKDNWNISDNVTMDTASQTLTDTLRSFVPGGTLTLTKDGWLPLDLTIRALEQSEGADVLSTPSVTTTDGTTAQIWVGNREILPTEFSPNSDDGTSVSISYNGWQERNIGVHLEVTPSVADNNLINLELTPEVIDLVSYDTYEVTPSNASMLIWSGADASEMATMGRYPIPNVPGMDTAWNIMSATLGGKDPNGEDPGAVGNNSGYFDERRKVRNEEFGVAVPQLVGALPVLRVRKIHTNLTVADGSTVGMGGLIYDKLETYKDRVPVLGSIPFIGRLFRSEGEHSVKLNLMIFVTATQVDVHGRRATDLENPR